MPQTNECPMILYTKTTQTGTIH